MSTPQPRAVNSPAALADEKALDARLLLMDDELIALETASLLVSLFAAELELRAGVLLAFVTEPLAPPPPPQLVRVAASM
ncbi:hypothetical protein [Gilvimarinus japonicus]|uniref:Response regulatory domain-containing protein n=1 Tax=Gilvimarinus japonicus TaxID=1796469 RepID=A0ABV7HNW4_9GAMM